MYCRNCGDQIGFEKVCPNCSTPAGEGNQRCPECGKRVTEFAHKCEHCGALMYKPVEDTYNGRKKIVVFLLAIFLGQFGIHNFVMGEIKRGVFRLLMTLVCGLGWLVALIDAVMIFIDKYHYDPDKILW